MLKFKKYFQCVSLILVLSMSQAVQAQQAPGLGILIKSATQTSAANTIQTLTITGAMSSRICVYSVALYSSAAGTATLVVQSATTTAVKYDLGTITTATEAKNFQLGASGFCGVTGEAVSVVVGAAGAAVTSTVSAIAGLQGQ